MGEKKAPSKELFVINICTSYTFSKGSSYITEIEYWAIFSSDVNLHSCIINGTMLICIR